MIAFFAKICHHRCNHVDHKQGKTGEAIKDTNFMAQNLHQMKILVSWEEPF